MNTKPIERGMWSEEEHDKFLAALKVNPKGPWKVIAAKVGTRSSRQVQTHAQKYYEKVARRMRGLRKDRKKLVRPEHRLDEDMMKLCQVSESVATATKTPSSPVRRALKPGTTTSSPISVDAVTKKNAIANDGDLIDASESFMALLGEPSELLDGSDSDDMDSLADVDDYYLDFLIDALDTSECMSDGESCSEAEALC
ncbi:Myb-like dna-binding protein [Globisporangium polare]